MKAILYDSTLGLAKFGEMLSMMLNDCSKAEIKRAIKSDSLLSVQEDAKKRYTLFINELDSNLQHIPIDNTEKYLSDLTNQFNHYLVFYPYIKEVSFMIRKNATQGLAQFAWQEMTELVNHKSLFLTREESVKIFVYYYISSQMADYCDLALEVINKQKLLIGNDINNNINIYEKSTKHFKNAKKDSWEGVLLGEFTLSKMRHILTILPDSLLDESGNLTEYSTAGNWAAVIAALRECKKIKREENAMLYRLLGKEFGSIISENHLKTGYNSESSDLAHKFFCSTQALAGI